MNTQTVNKDTNLLDAVLKVALDYRVRRIEQSPLNQRLNITYEVLGQGSALSDLINEKVRETAPDTHYRIKMIPSDGMLIFELL